MSVWYPEWYKCWWEINTLISMSQMTNMCRGLLPHLFIYSYTQTNTNTHTHIFYVYVCVLCVNGFCGLFLGFYFYNLRKAIEERWVVYVFIDISNKILEVCKRRCKQKTCFTSHLMLPVSFIFLKNKKYQHYILNIATCLTDFMYLCTFY